MHSPTVTSVPTPDVHDLLYNSVSAEAALTSVHTDWRQEDLHLPLALHAVGDCVNRPSAVLAKLRLTRDEREPDGSLHHMNFEIVAHVVKGENGDSRARVRLVGKQGAWQDTGMLAHPGDLQQYFAAVCPFLYDIPEIFSTANDPDFSDYVSYGGEGVARRRAVWVVLIDFTAGAPGGCSCSESELLSTDQRTLYWVHAKFVQSSPITSQQWSADYSRFNRPITIRLPKIGSTTP